VSLTNRNAQTQNRNIELSVDGDTTIENISWNNKFFFSHITLFNLSLPNSYRTFSFLATPL